MKQPISTDFKLGILGGGQLGKMLSLAASNWDVNTAILDPAADCPASTTCTELTVGDFNDYDAVYNFGQHVDVVTVEIERVNIPALKKLEAEGKQILPCTRSLSIIQDKGLQKQFYLENNIATSPFKLYQSADEIKTDCTQGTLTFPFVQKLRTGGYDGRGVAVIQEASDLNLLLEGESLVEDLVPISKEIAVIVARNSKGETKCFPSVEMEFNPKANLVEFLFCPANITPEQEKEAEELSVQVVKHLNFVGLLAVELFIDTQGNIFVNEVAPRPHNSGHHTIEGTITSQYEQHLRAVLGYPLGSTKIKLPSVMINILGEEGYEGPVKYQGIEDCMAVEGVKFHIYGKKVTKPFRKMGHATVI
ncbi:MAG: 5-(carboxyamino)imidazole ribonucleotide synthase, partial [Flavobacteriales bacterium]|nr:5-(carboxyamino)imidazole ribonucleotide synthase [Flavobacteriales bacterium]